MDTKDLQTAGVVGTIHNHLTVEATGAHQRRIQHVGAVGGRNDDDAGVALKAVHLREELVEGLFPLVVAAAEASATLTTHGVDLVNEDDARGVLLGLLEQVAHPAGTDTHEHLDELRTGDREERHTGLASDGLGQQGLTGTRRAHQQDTLGNLGADGGEAIGVLEEVDDLGQLELGAFNAGHITKGDLGFGLHLNPGLALAEVHGGVPATALGTTQEEEETTQQEQGEDQGTKGLLPGLGLTGRLDSDVDLVTLKELQQILVGGEVDHGALAVVLDHLGRAAIGSDQNP